MSSIKILVIEDEVLIARQIEGCLHQLGYEVVGIATRVETALQQLTDVPTDLVFVDIHLQGQQDGITLAEQVRDRFHIPFIYLTAYVDDSTLERAKQTRPAGYILKPFKQNDLRVAVEMAIARHQLEAEETKADINDTSPQSFDYLSLLSHELRNPLTVIQFSAKLLGDSRYPIDDAKKAQLLQRIQASTSSINQLIEDVLMVGQADHDTTLFHPETIDLVELCQTLLEPFQWNLESQHVIAFSPPPDPLFASVDQALFQHILNNLIGNAIKYSPDGRSILLQLYRSGQTVQLEVQDQGIGIPPEDLDCLFQPFRRGRNVGKLPGNGLGLAIVKRAIELHGGEITVTSRVSQGTTFTVKLPLQA